MDLVVRVSGYGLTVGPCGVRGGGGCDKKNELAIDEDPLLKEKQVEKQHLELIIENVLVGVEDFNFPISL